MRRSFEVPPVAAAAVDLPLPRIGVEVAKFSSDSSK